MSMVFCRACGKEVHNSAVACPQCGAPQDNPYSVGAASFASNTHDKQLGFFGWYLDAMKQYAVFKGRATRKAYWMFFLVNIIIAFVVGVVAGFTHTLMLSNIYSLAVLLPGIAIGVRRMHDTDRSGWWLLLPIANIIFLLLPSQPGSNRFGPARNMVA